MAQDVGAVIYTSYLQEQLIWHTTGLYGEPKYFFSSSNQVWLFEDLANEILRWTTCLSTKMGGKVCNYWGKKIKPVCLICKRPVAVMKQNNPKRHLDMHKNHKAFDNGYPLGSAIRKEKISLLRIGLHGQQSRLKFHCKESDWITEASF